MTGDTRLDGLIDIILSVMAYAFGIAAHECGHVLAVHLLGLEPRLLVIGKGPVVARRRVGRVWVVLRTLPIAGVVLLPN